MVPPHLRRDVPPSTGDAYPTLALSLIRLRGYREPGEDVLNEIVRDAAAAGVAEKEAATPVDADVIDHLDRLVQAAAAAGRLRRG